MLWIESSFVLTAQIHFILHAHTRVVSIHFYSLLFSSVWLARSDLSPFHAWQPPYCQDTRNTIAQCSTDLTRNMWQKLPNCNTINWFLMLWVAPKLLRLACLANLMWFTELVTACVCVRGGLESMEMVPDTNMGHKGRQICQLWSTDGCDSWG